MFQLLLGLCLSWSAPTNLATIKDDSFYEASNDWSPEEREVLNQFGLTQSDPRGIQFIDFALANPSDLIVETPMDGLVYFMTTGTKKDLVFVAVKSFNEIPDEFRKVMGIHEVVQYYLILTKKN